MKFFTSSGIPSPTNATYAQIFVKNRIAMDMLTELNKEYLREVNRPKQKFDSTLSLIYCLLDGYNIDR